MPAAALFAQHGDFLITDPRSTMTDPINHPPHYNAGPIEAINIIEQTVAHAPSPVLGGLQWHVLKYLLRLWHKNDSLEDARKARWYLDRLIQKLEESQP